MLTPKLKLTGPVLFIFILSLCINSVLLWHFHDSGWAPQDDGYFAHVAERILDGEVLNRDVQSRHAGYIHFLHAGMMACFGRSMAVLRYPLVFLSVLQSALVYLLFLNQGVLLAFLASIAITALGYIQILTPATHWYCLFLTLLAVFWLLRIPASKPYRIPVIGFLLGLTFLFRQLTAAFTGIGFLAYLLIEDQNEEKSNPVAARLLILGCLGLLIFYLMEHYDFLSFVLFMLWPIALLGWSFFQTQASTKKTLGTFLQLGLGTLPAFIPLAIYHSSQGSWGPWFEDSVIRSTGIFRSLPFESWASFAPYFSAGLMKLLLLENPVEVLNGFYWLLLPGFSFLNGLFLMLAIAKKRALSQPEFISFIAVFYALVSHLLQIPTMLFYSTAFSLIALLGILKNRFVLFYKLGLFSTLVLILTGIFLHAGQSVQRSFFETRRYSLARSEQLPKAGIRMRQEEMQAYEPLVAAIKKYTGPSDPLFIFPNDPELYFLSGRRNPFRFDFLSMALLDDKDFEQITGEIMKQQPRMVLYHRLDRYGDQVSSLFSKEELRLTLKLVHFIEGEFELKEKIGEFSIYLRKNETI